MIRLLLADDHQLFLDGLHSILATVPGIEVVARAVNGRQVLEQLQHHAVDLVLMDVNMPEMDGIQATEALKARHPEVKVLVLTMHNAPEFVARLLQTGAGGYVLKNTGREELVEAIRQVYSGHTYYGNAVPESRPGSPAPVGADRPTELTRREKEVLHLLARQWSIEQIADALLINPATAETHIRNLHSKLNAFSRAELIRNAQEQGLLP